MTLSRLGGNAMQLLIRSFWVLTGSVVPVAILILFGWATAMSRLEPLPETAWPGAQLLSLVALAVVGVLCAGAMVLNASVRLRDSRPASRR